METKSKLATVHYWTNNYSTRNGKKVSKIIIHHMAGNLDAKGCYNVWKNRQGSAHYAISSKGQIGQLIDEKYRAWSVANAAADSIAVTIELANDGGAKTNWHVSDKAIAKCIDLCVDICKRHGIKKLTFTGDTKGNLVMHRYYMATACPGPYLASKFKYIAEQVNKKLSGTTPEPKAVLYRVRKTWKDAKSQIGAFNSLENAKKACKQGYHVFDENGKVVYSPPAPKPPSKTKQDLMCEWAKMIADSKKYKYKRWTKAPKTHQCPICHPGSGDGWNCGGYTFASWHHGAELKSNCSCGVIADSQWEQILKAKTDAEALKIAQKCIGLKDIKVIRNGGKAIPQSQLQKGDIVSYYNGNEYCHTMLYIGNGKMAESTSGKTPNIGYGRKCPNVKVAIRYIGK